MTRMNAAMRMAAAMVVLLGAAGVARAEEERAEHKRLREIGERIAPFVGGQTILLLHVDMDRIDMGTILAQSRKMLAETGTDSKEVDVALAMAGVLADGFVERVREAGVKDVYYVLAMDELGESPGLIVVPTASAEKAKAAIDVLKTLMDKDATGAELAMSRSLVVGKNLVISNDAGLARARAFKPEARADIAQALRDAGGDVQAVFAWSPEMRKVAAELMPRLPEELGGGPAEMLTEGVEFVALGIKEPPEMEIRLRIGSASEARASEARATDALRLLETVRMQAMKSEGARQMSGMFGEKALMHLASEIMPKVDGKGLSLTFKEADLIRLAKLTTPDAAQVRDDAKRTASTSQVKQLITTCMVYQEEYKQAWPATLAEGMKAAKIEEKEGAKLLTSPIDGKTYVYRAPSEKEIKEQRASNVPVLWEASGKESKRVVGFADGHVEVMDEKEFAKAKERLTLAP